MVNPNEPTFRVIMTWFNGQSWIPAMLLQGIPSRSKVAPKSEILVLDFTVLIPTWLYLYPESQELFNLHLLLQPMNNYFFIKLKLFSHMSIFYFNTFLSIFPWVQVNDSFTDTDTTKQSRKRRVQFHKIIPLLRICHLFIDLFVYLHICININIDINYVYQRNNVKK